MFLLVGGGGGVENIGVSSALVALAVGMSVGNKSN